jgi:N-acetylneuraminic acid mutarotase
MLVFGGFDGSRVLNDLYAFDTTTGLWSQLVHTGISPPARAGHSATSLGVPAHMLVFGGANSSRRFNDVQLFDTADNHWTKPATRGQPPSPRYYHCACLTRGSLLIVGGNDGNACLADVHALNTESWAWSRPVTNGPPPSPRCGSSATLVNKLLFVLGGVGDPRVGHDGPLEHGDVHVLDTESWTWWRPEVAPALPPIAYHAAALVADKIFLFGGSTRDALYNDVLALDTSTCAWRVAARGDAERLPRRRRLGVARASGTRILFFGGWDGSHTVADLLEIDTSPWLRMDAPAQPAPNSRPVEAKAMAAGGGGTGGGATGGGAARAGPGAFDSSGGPLVAGGGAAAELALERMEARHEEELQRMRGEVARLRMSNELMGRELGKLKSLVGASMPGEHGGLDVDALATKQEVEALRAEVAKLRRLHSQERESDKGALRAEVDSLRRAVHMLSVRLDGADAGESR